MNRAVPSKKAYMIAFIAAGIVKIVGLAFFIYGLFYLPNFFTRRGIQFFAYFSLVFGILLLDQDKIVAGISFHLLADHLRPTFPNHARTIYGVGTAHMMVGYFKSFIITFIIFISVINH